MAPPTATLDIALEIVAPLENVIVAALQYGSVIRQTMSQPNRDRWDDLLLKAFERLDRAIEALLK